MTLATLILLVATRRGADGAPAALGHAAEVKLFASTMATIKVVTAACPDMLPNAAYLAGLRDRLHIIDADKPAFAEEGKRRRRNARARLGRNAQPRRLVRSGWSALRPDRFDDPEPVRTMNSATLSLTNQASSSGGIDAHPAGSAEPHGVRRMQRRHKASSLAALRGPPPSGD